MSVLELKGNLLQLLARLESEKRLLVLFETAQRFFQGRRKRYGLSNRSARLARLVRRTTIQFENSHRRIKRP